MTVTVRLPGQLRKYAGGNEFVNVAASTAAEALRDLAIVCPDLAVRLFDDQGVLHPHLIVFHLDAEVAREELDSAVMTTGDRLDLLIAVAGGAADVRMRGFRRRATVEEALAAALNGVAPLSPEPGRPNNCFISPSGPTRSSGRSKSANNSSNSSCGTSRMTLPFQSRENQPLV